ncbi:hypothetical protein N665_1570s0004 [Sinapis alba]|nr:hypothetical protein N665_1570s0004 [Sinapis alba]
MVAISMYRGNLHKVPDVPRRWTMPDRNLSYEQFKSLLHRRKRALSHLSLNSNSNPNLNLSLSIKTELVTDRNDAIPSKRPGSSGKQKLVEVKSEEIDGNLVSENENGRFEGSRGGDLPRSVMEVHEDATNVKVEAKEAAEEEKEQKEVEERLQVLNAKKHNLVQVLKQILNAEEELKRRSSITPPSLPLHVDVSNDSGEEQQPFRNTIWRRILLVGAHAWFRLSPGIRALQESLFLHLGQTTLLHLLHQLLLVGLLFSEKHGYRVHGISSFSSLYALTSSFFYLCIRKLNTFM